MGYDKDYNDKKQSEIEASGSKSTDCPQKPEIITGNYLLHEIQHILHLEYGYFYTVKEMLIRPGKTITTFLRVDRKKTVKPLIFLLFNAVIFTFTLQILKLNYQFFNIVLSGNTLMQKYVETESINKWLNSHIAYTAFFVGLFFAMLLRLFSEEHL